MEEVEKLRKDINDTCDRAIAGWQKIAEDAKDEVYETAEEELARLTREHAAMTAEEISNS